MYKTKAPASSFQIQKYSLNTAWNLDSHSEPASTSARGRMDSK
jgi:hypothetical protein